MANDITLDEALAYAERMDDEFRDGVNKVIEFQNSPGFALVLNYLKARADEAATAFPDVDPLDTKEIIRLQTTIRDYYRWLEAPGEFIRSAVGEEIAEEAESQVYDDS